MAKVRCVVFDLGESGELNPELLAVVPQLLEVAAGCVSFELRRLDDVPPEEDELFPPESDRSPRLGSQLVIDTYREGVAAVAFQHSPPPQGEWTDLDAKLSVMGTTLGTFGGAGNCMRSAHQGFAVWYKPI